MKLNKPFSLYCSCIAVKGYNRSLLCDTHRCILHYIPNDLYDILMNFEGKSIEEIIQFFGEESSEVILEYFNLLIENDLIHFCDSEELEYFPKQTYNWDSPSIITNAIIEYDNYFDLSMVLKQLEQLGCYYISFIIHKPLDQLSNLFKETIESNFRAFDLLVEDNNYNLKDIKSLLKKHLRIKQIVLYNSNKNDIIRGGIDGEGDIVFTKEKPDFKKEIQKPLNSFVLNKQFFYESKKYNTYYNRKVAINRLGQIKNCLSNEKFYGNVNECTINEIICNPNFQEIWAINKDKIEICQDCKFRYTCLDGRIPVKVDRNWKYLNKCMYNPYKVSWEDENNC